MSLLGHLTIAGLDEFGIDQVFSGAFGIDPEIGVTGTNLNETQTDRSLASSARRAHHARRPQQARPARARRGSCRPSAITTLITDDGADAGTLDRFRAAGVSVETC